MDCEEIMKKLLCVIIAATAIGAAFSIFHGNDTNAELTELRAERNWHGNHHLKDGTKTSHFSHTGPLTVTNYTLLSLGQTGPLTIQNSTIQKHASVTGPLTIQNSTIQKHASVTGPIEATDSLFESFDGTGLLSLKNSKVAKKLDCTGKSTLINCNVEDASITGKTNCSDSTFKSIKAIGSSLLKKVTATTGDFTGKLTAENCSIDDIKVTAKEIAFTNCKAKTLLIRKDKSTDTPIVHINSNDRANEETYIAKIVCENPNTRIIYGPNTRKADEISGTTNITYL